MNASISGYTTLKMNHLYATRGMGSLGRQDVICLAHIPFPIFQILMSRYASGELTEHSPFTEPAYQILGITREPARFRFASLSLETQGKIEKLTRPNGVVSPSNGFKALLTPDRDNQIANDPKSVLRYEVEGIYTQILTNHHLSEIEAMEKHLASMKAQIVN